MGLSLNHFETLVLFALIISVAFACLSRETPGERLRYGLKVFIAFVSIAVALGWLMYSFPR